MKQCTKCKSHKPLEDYNKCSRWPDGLQKHCKQCHKALNKKHYENNKQKYLDNTTKHREAARDWLREYKQQLQCSNCNENRWWVLDFHHPDPAIKEGNVAKMTSLSQLQREVEKCIVVCSNCHRDIHYQESL